MHHCLPPFPQPCNIAIAQHMVSFRNVSHHNFSTHDISPHWCLSQDITIAQCFVSFHNVSPFGLSPHEFFPHQCLPQLMSPPTTATTETKFPRLFNFSFQVFCLSSRLFYIQDFPQRQSSIDNSKQSNLTFVCVVGYWPLSGCTGSAQHKVSNLFCWNCQKDSLIHKFVLPSLWKHLDNDVIANWQFQTIIFDLHLWCMVLTTDHSQVSLFHHSTKSQIWYVEIVKKIGWSTSLYSPCIVKI